MDKLFKLDHILIWVDKDAPEIEFFKENGFTSIISGSHSQQGTSGKYLFFLNFYIELLYISDNSEACENIDGSILVKVEDTLAGKPLKMNVDLLVLMVGLIPSAGTKKIGGMLGLNFGVNGFLKNQEQHCLTTVSNVPGVFFAGTCVSPRTINNVFVDARAAALMTASYLNNYEIEKRIVY